MVHNMAVVPILKKNGKRDTLPYLSGRSAYFLPLDAHLAPTLQDAVLLP
jgi:hypothetical protein